MSISPWVQGQTHATWVIECQRESEIFDLTGQSSAYITVLFYSNVATVTGSYTYLATGTGIVTITQFYPGMITYKPASSDTLALPPGQYWVRVKVIFNGVDPDYSEYISFTVQA